MYCMKCGREMEEEHVFCNQCLAVMEKYPVKPGTAVQLPKRREMPFVKRPAPRRKALAPEEMVRKLRRALRTMLVIWVITFLLFCAALYPAVLYIMEGTHFSLGQNYSLISDVEAEE